MGIALTRNRRCAWRARALLGLIGSLASSVVVAWPGVAWAGVEVQGASTNVDVRKLDGLIALELGENAAAIDVVVNIADDASSAELVVRDVALSAERHAVVDLSGVTDIERIVALSVGELARSEPPPPPAPPPPPPPPASPPAAPDVVTPKSTASSRAPYGLAAFGVRRMLSGGASVVMPRLEGGFALSPPWRVGAFAFYGHASSDDVLGSISVDVAGAGLSTSFDFLRTGRLTMGTGPRIEFGWMWGRGEGAGGSTSSTPMFAATWQLQAFTRIVRSAGIVAAVDIGFAGPALDLHANDSSNRSVLDLAGPYAGLSLGLGVLPASPR